MKLTEKMSYLQGLMDGLELDKTTKEGKIISQMNEVLSELVLYVEDLQSQVDELTELCEILDEDLGHVEDDIYDDFGGKSHMPPPPPHHIPPMDFDECGDCRECFEDDDFDDDEELEFGEDEEDFGLDEDDDELYEVTCPTCGDTILIDEGMMEEGSISCPNCHELLEFDYDDITLEDIEGLNEEESEDSAEDNQQ